MIFSNDGLRGHHGSDGKDGCNGYRKRLSGATPGSARQTRIISYLAKLGLTDDQLLKAMELLQSVFDAELAYSANREELRQVMTWEDLLRAARPAENTLGGQPATRGRDHVGRKAVRLYIAEEHQILRDAYRTFFGSHPSIQMLGCSSDTSAEGLAEAATTSKPDVMIVGVKMLHRATVENLDLLREDRPALALVLLFALYDVAGIKALREFSGASSAGRAYLLKDTIDTVERLEQEVYAVAEGRVIIDPMVMAELVEPDDHRGQLLRTLSPRELEVLGCVAKGYRNDTIADLVCCDIRTVERHINSIYHKLYDGQLLGSVDSEDRRVRAALMYLRATGLLGAEQTVQQ